MRALLVLSVALVAAAAPVAAAKDFRPGSVRVCTATGCAVLSNQRALDSLSAFYYGPRVPAPATAPRPSARYVELRYPNGYVTGIAAGARFDRFLSFGVNLGQFTARQWYRIPAPAAAAIRRIADGLAPARLPHDILRRSR